MADAHEYEPPPLPAVGWKVRKNFGPRSSMSWPHFGEVRAIVDDRIIVVMRYSKRHGDYIYEVVDRIDINEFKWYDIKNDKGVIVTHSKFSEHHG